ncbi:metallophosphoesterase family protein [Staphylococcus simiae]|uniref:Calcineurin-like phosphoesterase domain-containing protein n=1 Tax=Staphylococcus simiae CCM 7213 = CCUG 51256 TaxID=911238 RepID=G5JME2_9STAP|nr:metallophosphoesterase family protein [Staphylococcus simiae]EHJ06632.1 hypothetical protein SS7213T_13347 [Staphylococcus simiae CCM 7213 = CCUG 51256]PNZ11204.1 metallophosphoesterase [Staphylococcus simiae]SNV77661.1 metallophosphoesterase [Staphylococcus simiae]
MRKFAIITDIHGNADALERVLDDIDRRGDIDKIYNLGDHIGIGHETNKVLDMIFDRQDMTMIAGNHDEAIMSVVNGTPYPEYLYDKFYEHHHWVESHLDEEYYDALNELPRYIEEDICGKKVLFIHYEITNDMLEAPIDQVPFSPIAKDEEQAMSELFADKEADLIVFGHNHRLHMFDDKTTIYFNPGSVGLNNGANTVYGIVTISEHGINIERVKLQYDDEEFIKGFKEKKVPATELIFDKFM